MQCANPSCRTDAQHLENGTLRLFEMEVPPGKRTVGADFGFPVFVVPTRYFWLCAACSRFLTMRRWTSAGLVLEPNPEAFSREAYIQNVKTPLAGRGSQLRLRASLENVA
jgi:hypothetical protein